MEMHEKNTRAMEIQKQNCKMENETFYEVDNIRILYAQK